MGFTKALYYPTIDIGNWDWAKSVALFWDNIQTIVPESIKEPYSGNVTSILSDEGVLTPHFVSPDMQVVQSLSEEVINFLETNEGFDYLIKNSSQTTTIHEDKLPRDIRRLSTMHPEKLSHEIRYMLDKGIGQSDWIEVDTRFAGFYMSLLANKICEKERLVLLTDDGFASNLTEKARLANQRKIFGRGVIGEQYSHRYESTTLHLSQGMLSNLVLKGIRFSPDTKVQDILKFKRKHQDELGLFRGNLEKLVSSIPENTSFEALQQHVEDIYINEFKPAYNNFKKALSGFKLKWVNDHIMKVAFFNGGTGALLPFIFGATIPQALLAGAGISVVTSVISYDQAKQEILRENPYSFLVSTENELNKQAFEKALMNTLI